jgi:chromosome segregation ATPase
VRGSLGCWCAAALGAALMCSSAFAEGNVYTCVDAKGRRLTSDRPIIDCIDREQREISPSGRVVRRIKPAPTASEAAAEEAAQRRAIEERSRQNEEKRRDRALLTRYPDVASHNKERQAGLASLDDAIRSAQHRITDLQAERRKLDAELEFFKGDLAKAPPPLRRRIEENEQQVAGQQRFIATKEEEKTRVNGRYDEELARLRKLWSAQPPTR